MAAAVAAGPLLLRSAAVVPLPGPAEGGEMSRPTYLNYSGPPLPSPAEQQYRSTWHMW